MSTAEQRRFTETHEWARVTDDGLVEIGISDFGQHQLADIVNVELPEVSDHLFEAGEDVGVVESVKTASDYYAPVKGTVVQVNEELLGSPELINEEPYGRGWILRLKVADVAVVETLMTAAEYDATLPED